LITGRLFILGLFQCLTCLFWQHVCSASVSGSGAMQFYYQKRDVIANLYAFMVCRGTALLYLYIPFTMGKHLTY